MLFQLTSMTQHCRTLFVVEDGRGSRGTALRRRSLAHLAALPRVQRRALVRLFGVLAYDADAGAAFETAGADAARSETGAATDTPSRPATAHAASAGARAV